MVFRPNTNNLLTVIWYQVFLLNTKMIIIIITIIEVISMLYLHCKLYRLPDYLKIWKNKYFYNLTNSLSRWCHLNPKNSRVSHKFWNILVVREAQFRNSWCFFRAPESDQPHVAERYSARPILFECYSPDLLLWLEARFRNQHFMANLNPIVEFFASWAKFL